MKPLSVYLLGREVATLEPSGDFKSVLSYHPHVAVDVHASGTSGHAHRPNRGVR